MATATEVMGVHHTGPCGLIPPECDLPTFSEKDSVWIGFMDIVPVIGSVRESVELVLALYEGNKEVVQEKEKVFANMMKFHESVQKHKPSAPVKPAEGEFSGLTNVREIRNEWIIECMAKGSKKGPKPPTADEQKKRKKEMDRIRDDMLKKIRIIDPKFTDELKEQLTRSNRGEHVFNYDILKFHSKVLRDFIEKHHTDNLPEYHQQVVNELGGHTLEAETAEDIGKVMVVDFDDDEFYVNANAMLYGRYCKELHDTMLAVLDHRNPLDIQWVKSIIDNMNVLQIYVDQPAKEKWLNQGKKNKEKRKQKFKKVVKEVWKMYETDRGVDWCICLPEKVASWFKKKNQNKSK